MKKQLSDKLNEISPSMTLSITSLAKKLKEEGREIYSFGAGEPDFDTPRSITEAATEGMNKGITRYTDVKGLPEFREAIKNQYKKDYNLDYTVDEIVVSSGAKHSLFTALQALVTPEDEVIIPIPYWVSYPEMVKMVGGKCVFVNTKKEDNFVLKKEELLKVITNKTKAIMINNPSNPTGGIYKKEELLEIANVCLEKGIYIISDEIYDKLLYDDSKHIPTASLSKEIKDITITINGLSKTYAMTGWRIGYSLCNIEIANAMSKVQGHCVSHPSTISQCGGIAALTMKEDILNERLMEYDKRRRYMIDALKKVKDIDIIYPKGAFYVFVDISKYYGKCYNNQKINGSLDFSETLLKENNVAVIPGIGFGSDDFIRLSYATSLFEIKKGLEKLIEFINKLK